MRDGRLSLWTARSTDALRETAARRRSPIQPNAVYKSQYVDNQLFVVQRPVCFGFNPPEQDGIAKAANVHNFCIATLQKAFGPFFVCNDIVRIGSPVFRGDYISNIVHSV